MRALARVLPDGRIATIGLTRRPEEDAAAAATGLSERGATAWTPAEAAGPPALVCDGAVGREAWFVRIAAAGVPERWAFATGGGQYERAAGTPPRGGIVG